MGSSFSGNSSMAKQAQRGLPVRASDPQAQQTQQNTNFSTRMTKVKQAIDRTGKFIPPKKLAHAKNLLQEADSKNDAHKLTELEEFLTQTIKDNNVVQKIAQDVKERQTGKKTPKGSLMSEELALGDSDHMNRKPVNAEENSTLGRHLGAKLTAKNSTFKTAIPTADQAAMLAHARAKEREEIKSGKRELKAPPSWDGGETKMTPQLAVMAYAITLPDMALWDS